MVVAEVVFKEVNKALVKEFNEGLVKFYLCKVKQIKFEVLVYEVVDKEVNKELVEEVIKLSVVTEMMVYWTRRLA